MKRTWMLAVLAATLLLAPAAGARGLVIKLGSVAPQGSIWHKALLEMAEAFEQETKGQVQLKVYAGVVGDEATIVRKMRVGQLQAAALTNSGIALITSEPMAVQLPMQFDNYAELDATMVEMAPVFDRALEEDGFVNLLWADAGWMHFFTRKPAVSLDDVKNMKMWMWGGDPKALESFAVIGFAPVVLSGVDIIPSLQTGMIDALPTTPISALAIQSYPLTPHMIDVKWGLLLGGVVITKEAWERIPAEARPRLRERCHAIGVQLVADTRRDSDKAVELMRSKGMAVHTPNAAQMAAWRERARQSLLIVRGGSVDAALADQALAARDRYRASQSAKAAKAP